jgi:hypothetical protein
MSKSLNSVENLNPIKRVIATLFQVFFTISNQDFSLKMVEMGFN